MHCVKNGNVLLNLKEQKGVENYYASWNAPLFHTYFNSSKLKSSKYCTCDWSVRSFVQCRISTTNVYYLQKRSMIFVIKLIIVGTILPYDGTMEIRLTFHYSYRIMNKQICTFFINDWSVPSMTDRNNLYTLKFANPQANILPDTYQFY